MGKSGNDPAANLPYTTMKMNHFAPSGWGGEGRGRWRDERTAVRLQDVLEFLHVQDITDRKRANIILRR